MRFNLLDEEDLKSLETAFARAIVRAIRTLAKDGLFSGLATAAAEPEASEPPDVAAVQPPSEVPAEPVNGKHVPAFLKPAPDNPVPASRATEPPPAPVKVRKPNRSVIDILHVVGDRPRGYIDTETAYKIINLPGGASSSSATLSAWIRNKEVDAVIVANVKPPTKNLPGRLMIDADSLRARNALRRKNSHKPISQRESFEAV